MYVSETLLQSKSWIYVMYGWLRISAVFCETVVEEINL